MIKFIEVFSLITISYVLFGLPVAIIMAIVIFFFDEILFKESSR